MTEYVCPKEIVDIYDNDPGTGRLLSVVLEAVARGIAREEYPNRSWRGWGEGAQTAYRNAARAAITALAANVSPEMVTAAANALGKRDPVSGDDWKITIAAAIRAGGEP